ncbi:MAG: hypothetical protein HYU67_01870 [Flavobacteriia bacterium]|nr:hypothetical protein [Flavobacteriia bacterium]
MRGLHQATYVNPSFIPKVKVYVALPIGMQNFYYGNTGITFNDLVKKDDNGKYLFDSESVVSKLKDKNTLSFETQNEFFCVAVKAAGFYFSGSVVNRFKLDLTYPKDFVQFALEGNGANFLDKRASFDGLAFNLSTYMEYGLGVARKIGDKLSVGGRIKLLSGGTNFTTKDLSLGIYTDPNTFDLTIDGHGEINTSGFDGLFKDSSIVKTASDILKNNFNFKNKGFGLDLGASYDLNDFLTITASVIDIGSINWKNNTKNYVKEDFNFKFRGVDFNEFLSDSSKSATQILKDTITGIFKTNENSDSYKTGLGTKYYFGAFYKLGEKMNISLLFQDYKISKTHLPALTLGFNAAVKNWLTFNINYTYANKSWSNLGLGLSIKAGGPFQTYLITDNILGLFSRNSQKSFHICVGMAFAIKDKKVTKKVVDAILPGDQTK